MCAKILPQVVRWRAKVGNQYCRLDLGLSKMGVLIPAVIRATDPACHAFEHKVAILAAIKRTESLQSDVSKSMLAQFHKFKPLLFCGRLEVEEFHIDDPIKS